MTRSGTVPAVAAAIAVLVMVAIGVGRASARQAVFVPTPDDVRFEMISNEPVAAPDGRSLVAGWAVQVLRDRTSGECFAVFNQGAAITSSPVGCPPR